MKLLLTAFTLVAATFVGASDQTEMKTNLRGLANDLSYADFLLTNVMVYLDTDQHTFQKCALEYLMSNIDNDVYEDFTCAFKNRAYWCGSDLDLQDASDRYDSSKQYQVDALNNLQYAMETTKPTEWKQFIAYWREYDQCMSTLCLYSNVAEDVGSPGIDAGHAAMILVDGKNNPTTYGLWPDDHAAIVAQGLANGGGSDVRMAFSLDEWSVQSYPYIYCEQITYSQLAMFAVGVAQDWEWRVTNNCASFVSEVFYDVTGTDVDADDVGGFETPRELGMSIRELNGGDNQSDILPPSYSRSAANAFVSDFHA